jgi:DNA-binding MarR family transcriptional regulator
MEHHPEMANCHRDRASRLHCCLLKPPHPEGLVAFARRFLSLLVKEPLAANLLGQARWCAGSQPPADLADLILITAREIQFRGYTDPRAIPLSQSEGMIMHHLQADPALPPGCIAAATGLQRTNLSAVLHGLERKGLIERHASPGDRRGMIVRATQHGRPTARCGRPPR